MTETDKTLKFFYGEGCPYTKKVQPAVNCVEMFLGKNIEKLEIYHSPENKVKYTKANGPQNCGGVPYFYNETTQKSVCGACSCDTLKEWAAAKEKIARL
jgi:thiol-disulfide isomerase/thioredoxin